MIWTFQLVLTPFSIHSRYGLQRREKKACAWLREFSSYSCLTAMPGSAWVLLSKTCKPFFLSSVYGWTTKLKLTRGTQKPRRDPVIALVKPPALAGVGKAAVLFRAHVLRALFFFAILGVLAEYGGDDDEEDKQDLYGVAHRRSECAQVLCSCRRKRAQSRQLNF